MRKRISLKSGGLRLLVAAFFLLPLLVGTAGIAAASNGRPGAVYTLTNAASGNAVVEYDRAADGSLAPGGTFDTGGLGSGESLGSQGAIALSQDNRWLFAVNAGSNEISSFAVRPGELKRVDKIPSGGSAPISLAVYHNLLYVLNSGGSGNITGFLVGPNGRLFAIPASTRLLSNKGQGSAPGPAQIAFSPDGRSLIVTEKNTNRIDSYAVAGVLPLRLKVNASSGETPFGFAFNNKGVLIVSEATTGALSSYHVSEAEVKVISASVVDNQTAACWVAVTGNGKYAYTTNAGSGSISGYAVSPQGKLTLLNADGRTGVTGDNSHPTDMGLSANSQFLYTLDNGSNAISAFKVNADGSLTSLGDTPAPAGAAGLAAR